MDAPLGYVIYDFQSALMFVSFVISLRLVNNKNIPNYMKGFYWYPVVGIIVLIPDMLALHFFQDFSSITIPINNISLLFHYSFLSLFIIRAIRNKNLFIFRIIFFLFFSMIVFFLSIQALTKFNSSAFAIANLGLVIFCLIYYLQLFTNIPTLNLKNEPSFWIITGVFFCMSIHVPIICMVDYLVGKIPYKYLNIFACIGAICYGTMHIFFIKAYLCSVRQLKQ